MLGSRVLRQVEDGARYLQGGDPLEPLSLRDLSLRHLGTVPREWHGESEGVLLPPLDDEGYQIGVRADLSPERARLVCAHELAHWYWEEVVGFRRRGLEQRCDALGAALVAPRRAVERVFRHRGLDIPRMAADLRTTQSVALLRLGEVMGVPSALLRKHRSTIIRGPFVRWPVPLSWQPAKGDVAGVTRVAISDEPRRFGVVFGDANPSVRRPCRASLGRDDDLG